MALLARKNETRLDANETIFFERELESIDSQTYDIKFPLLKGKNLVPPVSNVSATDETYTYRQYRTAGKAKIIANSADDLPSVNVAGKEFRSGIKPLGDSYSYDIFEIKAAAANGKPLDPLLARAARQAIEELIDDLIAFGNVAHDMQGFVNNAAVTVSTAAANNWVGSTPATGLDMVNDVNALLTSLWTQLKEVEGIGGKFVIAMPAGEYARFASEPVGTDVNKTALRFILDNSPFIEEIVPWHKLTGAGAGGNTNRMVAYVRDPMVLGRLVPQEYSPQAPQQIGLRFTIPVVARCGGSLFRYPVAALYKDIPQS